MAPEVLQGQPQEKSDIYSLGQVIKLLLKSKNDLVNQMCQRNVRDRCNLEQMAAHPWLNDNFCVTIRCLENILQMDQQQ